jgi:amino acid transporter
MENIAENKSTKFGTFAGVFTPSILTIFGVIMFMRANYVTGDAGIINALIILGLAQFITFLTTFSVGAISTNMQVEGGGAYYMVSRVLGAEFGGAIGIALFMAQVISITFYLLGFTEAITVAFPSTANYFMYIGLAAAIILFAIARIGADWAIKTQYVIMAVLFTSIFIYLAGAGQHFSVNTFKLNLYALDPAKGGTPFWSLFAIYFPSVTGFIAGINMSGDLEDPGKNMLRGTIYSLLVASLVYGSQILLYGGAFAREDLIKHPFEVMKNNALFGAGFMVIAGVCAATLSSALGRFVGAPRVLQAIARDEILPFLRPFAKGKGKNNEPVNGLYFCIVATIIMLCMGGNGEGGKFLNYVAGIMGMFFLYTFGLLNLAAFVELYTANPSYRPRFKHFHWSLALLGTILSFGSAILIDYKYALAAFVVLCVLIWYLRRRDMNISFGDARRGYYYTRIRKSLFALQSFHDDDRNWRPSILVLSGDPNKRNSLVTYANRLNCGKGIVTLANVLKGSLQEMHTKREEAIKQLHDFLDENNMKAFPHVVIGDTLQDGVRTLLRGTAYTPIRPNILACGWTATSEKLSDYLAFLREASLLNINQVIIHDGGNPIFEEIKRIDLWWRGHENGPLMMLLAHLLMHSIEYSNSRLVVKRVVGKNGNFDEAENELKQLIDEARMDADIEIVESETSFAETLHKNSHDACCVFLGFELPNDENSEKWHESYKKMLVGMPTSVLVHSVVPRNYLW